LPFCSEGLVDVDIYISSRQASFKAYIRIKTRVYERRYAKEDAFLGPRRKKAMRYLGEKV